MSKIYKHEEVKIRLIHSDCREAIYYLQEREDCEDYTYEMYDKEDGSLWDGNEYESLDEIINALKNDKTNGYFESFEVTGVTEIQCAMCGTVVKYEDNFCSKCGHKLEELLQ